MSVKILKMLLIMFALLILSGCSAKEPIYIDRVVKVDVPVKCKVPEVKCEYSGTYTETVKKMQYCIEDLKEAIGVCK